MSSGRMSLGIAQTAFYAPALPLAIFLFWRNGRQRPRMAWWPLIPLTLMRLVGGIITIILEKHPNNIGLIIAALVLLNVGVVPLIVAMLGQIRIILTDNYSDNPHSTKIAKGLRIAFIVAIILRSAGGGLSSSDRTTARILSLVGYGVLALELAILIAINFYFVSRRAELIPTSHKVLRANLTIAPFLIVRTIYGILEVVFEFQHDSPWSPLYGNLYAFALMCLLMEYICICVYFWLGFSMPPDRGVKSSSNR